MAIATRKLLISLASKGWRLTMDQCKSRDLLIVRRDQSNLQYNVWSKKEKRFIFPNTYKSIEVHETCVGPAFIVRDGFSEKGRQYELRLMGRGSLLLTNCSKIEYLTEKLFSVFRNGAWAVYSLENREFVYPFEFSKIDLGQRGSMRWLELTKKVDIK